MFLKKYEGDVGIITYTKGKIIIVECYSSAVNYIHDIRVLGYEPVLLELYTEFNKLAAGRAANDHAYSFNNDEMPAVIMAKESYDETLDMVKELGPILILPGCDLGLELAMRLSCDLGLRTNDMAIFPRIRDKIICQNALKAAGIRHIKTRAASSLEDALDFFRSEAGGKVVVKRNRGTASRLVFVCKTEDELINAYLQNESFIKKRKRHDEQIMVQEYIDGEEFALDTVSCCGRHTALFGMKYVKRLKSGYGKVYDTDIYFSPDDSEYSHIVDYVFRVLDCLGIEYGAVHSEIMVDERGPVLVEVNCRPAGVFQKYSFQDTVMQEHETAVSLNSYLMTEEEFFRKYPVRMGLRRPAVVKQLVLEEDIYVKRVRINEALADLPGFVYALDNGENCVYPKTTNLFSHGGMIFLTHEQQSELERACEYLNSIEKDGLDRIYDIDKDYFNRETLK